MGRGGSNQVCLLAREREGDDMIFSRAVQTQVVLSQLNLKMETGRSGWGSRGAGEEHLKISQAL